MTEFSRKKKKPLVFIAEDLPKNLQVVYNLLSKEGYDVAAAGDGKKALAMLQKVRPDIILLDVMMPEMNGFDVCRRVKEIPGLEDIPIIFLTAMAGTEDIVEGLELGAVDYITKPFKAKELITRVKNHLDLKFAREALEESNALKARIFSIIAHDVRNPLNNLVLTADFLREGFDTFKKEKLENIMHRFCDNTDTLASMIDNLLQWSLSQQNMMVAQPGKVFIAPLVSGIIELLHRMLEKKEIDFQNRIDPGISVFVDEEMVRIILRNLITNAVKFTPKGGEIAVNAEDCGETVDINVTDTGGGISQKDLPLLFSPGSTVSTVGTEGEKGTGLGLILCKELVEKNNGSIDVASEPGKETRFTVSFPKEEGSGQPDW